MPTESAGSDLGRKYAEAMFAPRDLTPKDQAMIAARETARIDQEVHRGIKS